jgi:prepilin-type N-terminal cleavage/methylation domain-containing protein
MKVGKKRQKGFTLLECMFAMVITVIGLTAVLGMVVAAIHLETFSRDTSAATGFAKEKIEELRNYEPTATERGRGGSLTSDVTNYFDFPDGRFKRRWLIEESPTDTGVPTGTQRITLTVLSNRSDILITEVKITILVSK